MPAQPTKLANLQVLRFAAAMMVVLYHACAHYAALGGDLPVGYMKYIGFAGVDIFFVLSGFVIYRTTTSLAGPSDAASFAYRRAARIYIPYLPIAIVYGLIYFNFGLPNIIDRISLLKSLTLWPAADGERLIDVTWTLTYELAFYAVFSLCVLLPLFRGAILTSFAATVGVLIALRLRGAVFPDAVDFLANPLVFEFLLGVLVGKFTLSHNSRYWFPWLAGSMIGFVLTGLIYMAFDYVPGGLIGDLLRVATYGVLSALLVFAVVSMEGSVKPPRVLVVLGDASYALYILHRVIITGVWSLLPAHGFSFLLENKEVGWLAIVGCSIVASVGYHLLIEKPLLNMSRLPARYYLKPQRP